MHESERDELAAVQSVWIEIPADGGVQMEKAWRQNKKLMGSKQPSTMGFSTEGLHTVSEVNICKGELICSWPLR